MVAGSSESLCSLSSSVESSNVEAGVELVVGLSSELGGRKKVHNSSCDTELDALED